MSSASPGGRGISLSIGAGPRRAEPPRPSSAELHVLVAADCSGRAARGVQEPLRGRRVQRVDADRWEGVVASWHARVETPLRTAAGDPVWLEPRSLDELHPDHLLDSAPGLAELSALLKKLDSEPGAAARLEALLGSAQPGAMAAPKAHPAAAAAEATSAAAAAAGEETSADTLARLLGGAAASDPAPPRAPARAAARVDIDQFIRAIIGSPPAAKPASATESATLRAAAEAELGRRLRLVLAAPAVRALEATWRGIDGLWRSCPDEEQVRLSVLDASSEEVLADPAGLAECLERCGPSVLLVDHLFGADAMSLQALARSLEACHAREVELLAGAHPHLARCDHFAELSQPEESERELPEEVSAAWSALLRSREQGARFSLALPRFCLRQPYGASGEPLEHFRFEEILDRSDHEAFPWGNGAYLLARALGIRHASQGRGLHPDGSLDVRELPVIHLDADGETRIKPCAESWLSERSLGRLQNAGFSVLQGLRDSDRVRVHF